MFALFEGIEKALRELLQEVQRQQAQGAYVRGWQDGVLVLGVFALLAFALFLGMERALGCWRYAAVLLLGALALGLLALTLGRHLPPPPPPLPPAPLPAKPRRRPREDFGERPRPGGAAGEAAVYRPGEEPAPGGADSRTGGPQWT